MQRAFPDPLVLEWLGRPDAYPDDPSAAAGVTWIQTHLSHVFLTGERVYKFRKPVDLGFVCFTARDERDADCLREVRLNRRLAADVYLGVAPLHVAGDHVRVGPAVEAIDAAGPEHCVVMRRLPTGRDALSLLEAGRLGATQLDRLARRIARFHAAHGLGTPVPLSPEAWRTRCAGPALDNLRLLEAHTGSLSPPARADLARTRAAVEAFVAAHADRFEARRHAGRGVDGHGDLHLQHVWFERDDSEPIAIDGLEFSTALRQIDAAAEVAFPAMDLVYRGWPALAERFLRVYARESGDFDLYGVVDFFASYRAAVRAKVAALAAADAGVPDRQRERARQSARRHLRLAASLATPRAPAAIALVCGIVGTGKTTLAEALADALATAPGAVVVSSDRVRKQRAGLAPETRTETGTDRGLYAPEAKQAVYRALLAAAQPIARSGRIALLDATWSRRADRDAARALAGSLGVPLRIVEAQCSDEIAVERLRRRRAQGRDASDAGPEFHATSRARFEPCAADEHETWRSVDTAREDWRDAARETAGWLAAARPGGSGARNP